MILQVSPSTFSHYILVATAEVGNSHAVHAMVLEFVLADIKRDLNGQPILNSGGNPELENYSFKFKNTDRNDKNVIIDAGKIS